MEPNLPQRLIMPRTSSAVTLVAACTFLSACASVGAPESAHSTATYRADVPDSIITPNQADSKYLGKLNFIDGAPDRETSQKARDFVDTADAVRVFLSGIPVASIRGLLAGHVSIGMVPNQTIGISEGLLNARSIWLTANTTTPYP